MNKTTKLIILSSLFIFNKFSFSHDIKEINHLIAKCNTEKKESLSVLIEPASCKKLNKIIDDIKKSKDQENELKNELTYEWNGDRYCFFNKKHEPVSCF